MTRYLYRYFYSRLDGRGTAELWNSVWAESPEAARVEAERRVAAEGGGFGLVLGEPAMQQTADGVARDMRGWALPDRFGQAAQIVAHAHETELRDRFFSNPEVAPYPYHGERADLRRRTRELEHAR